MIVDGIDTILFCFRLYNYYLVNKLIKISFLFIESGYRKFLEGLIDTQVNKIKKRLDYYELVFSAAPNWEN